MDDAMIYQSVFGSGIGDQIEEDLQPQTTRSNKHNTKSVIGRESCCSILFFIRGIKRERVNDQHHLSSHELRAIDGGEDVIK